MNSHGRAPRADNMTKKLFIRTFGCQMNEYDSDKMADLLHAAKGFEITDQPENADLILFNTCSVRERAQEKVFHDLGRVKHLKQARRGLLIGVGGCVGSQEGAAIVARAPRSEEHTSELQSQSNLVCRLLLEKKKKTRYVSSREHTTDVQASRSVV